MWGITDVETPPFGANTLSHSIHFINIATRITLGVCLNGSVWWHALSLSLIIIIWLSISRTWLLDEVVLRSISMFVNSALMGSNYLFIRVVLISNPPLMYMYLTVSIEYVVWFRLLFLMHSMIVNLILRLMVANKGIFFDKKGYFRLWWCSCWPW